MLQRKTTKTAAQRNTPFMFHYEKSCGVAQYDPPSSAYATQFGSVFALDFTAQALYRNNTDTRAQQIANRSPTECKQSATGRIKISTNRNRK
ncbi:MAG TPA: hypothetical protein VF450_09315 [Noviherbaspirillum sp.]